MGEPATLLYELDRWPALPGGDRDSENCHHEYQHGPKGASQQVSLPAMEAAQSRIGADVPQMVARILAHFTLRKYNEHERQ